MSAAGDDAGRPLLHLVVEHPDAGPRLVAVHAAESVIGRAADCAVVIDDDRVSRHHAVVVVRDGRVTVRDLGSRNGTFVNGAGTVGDVEIDEDDLVAVGRARLAVRRRWAASAATGGEVTA